MRKMRHNDVRIDRRTVLLLAGAGLAGPSPARGAAALDVSDWVETGHARLRLIDAGRRRADGVERLAGLQVELDPSYLTYWRTPGEAGVPPAARFEGSSNLAAATLLFPAPHRYDEAGAEAYGYRDGVVFPLAVTPTDAGRPVGLTATLAFAVCAALCLPAAGTASLTLEGSGTGVEAGLVRDALAQVPVPRPVGAPGPLAVLAVSGGSSRDRFVVTAAAPEGAALFVEAADPWYIRADGGSPAGAGRVTFDLEILAGPKTAARVPIRLTLATATQAIDVLSDLDVMAAKP